MDSLLVPPVGAQLLDPQFWAPKTKRNTDFGNCPQHDVELCEQRSGSSQHFCPAKQDEYFTGLHAEPSRSGIVAEDSATSVLPFPLLLWARNILELT